MSIEDIGSLKVQSRECAQCEWEDLSVTKYPNTELVTYGSSFHYLLLLEPKH
jgi:hypothetical protein